MFLGLLDRASHVNTCPWAPDCRLLTAHAYRYVGTIILANKIAIMACHEIYGVNVTAACD